MNHVTLDSHNDFLFCNSSVMAISGTGLHHSGNLEAIDDALPRSYLSRLRGRKPRRPQARAVVKLPNIIVSLSSDGRDGNAGPVFKTVRTGCKPIARSGERR